jgi:hypothetical protein
MLLLSQLKKTSDCFFIVSDLIYLKLILELKRKFLFIQVKPKAHITLNDHNAALTKNNVNTYQVLENTNEILQCESYSNPAWTKIEWYKDGQFLSELLKNLS